MVAVVLMSLKVVVGMRMVVPLRYLRKLHPPIKQQRPRPHRLA
jgi:hypothetical protein